MGSSRDHEILAALAGREATGSELAAELGRAQTSVAKSLRRMYEAGLLSRRPVGVFVYYSRTGKS